MAGAAPSAPRGAGDDAHGQSGEETMSTQGLTRVAALLAVLLWSAAGGAQTYPIKPVRIIVPYQAGQGTDVAARYLAQELGSDRPATG